MSPSFGAFEDEVEEGQPNTINGRYPLKFAGGPPTCVISVEPEWDF